METATGRTAYEYEFVIQHHAEFEIVSYGPGSLGSMVVRLRYIGRWEP